MAALACRGVATVSGAYIVIIAGFDIAYAGFDIRITAFNRTLVIVRIRAIAGVETLTGRRVT